MTMDIDMELDDLSKDTDSEYEEEELLIYIDIEPTSIAESQIGNAQNLKILGLDTKKPLLQIGNQFFEGEFDYSMGTHLFFAKNEEMPVDQLYCKCDRYYQYWAKTNKLLKMSRVLIKDNTTESKIVQEDTGGIKNQLRVQRTYQDALNFFLAPGKNPPRQIAEDYNCDHLLNYETPPEVSQGKEKSKPRKEKTDTTTTGKN